MIPSAIINLPARIKVEIVLLFKWMWWFPGQFFEWVFLGPFAQRVDWYPEQKYRFVLYRSQGPRLRPKYVGQTDRDQVLATYLPEFVNLDIINVHGCVESLFEQPLLGSEVFIRKYLLVKSRDQDGAIHFWTLDLVNSNDCVVIHWPVPTGDDDPAKERLVRQAAELNFIDRRRYNIANPSRQWTTYAMESDSVNMGVCNVWFHYGFMDHFHLCSFMDVPGVVPSSRPTVVGGALPSMEVEQSQLHQKYFQQVQDGRRGQDAEPYVRRN